VLPLAYDIRRHEWFDTTASAVRHFRGFGDAALDWREQPLTFNTSCHGCHVSQLTSNYDEEHDLYHTTWVEPGINCETCHGPGAEHVKASRTTKSGPPADLKIISLKQFSHDQVNALCASCHAKLSPLTSTFKPGEDFFDHYDLATLEDRDFHPDARDLGENYTYTLWLSSGCAKSKKLDCLHCHTSSGRYRFEGTNANLACAPCHENKVKDVRAHSHHPAGLAGNRCADCHMPTTEFARMRRTDHSMRPPAPAATVAFQSPNACNLCHTNQGVDWADRWVRQWHHQDYQAAVLARANLINTARSNDWTKLPAMLEYLDKPGRDEVFTASLIRMMVQCPATNLTPHLVRKLRDPSALIRSSAATTLGEHLQPTAVSDLLAATRDKVRLVRIRAATALAAVPPELVPQDMKPALAQAVGEFEQAMHARPDDSASHYNLANFCAAQGQLKQACVEYEKALAIQPHDLASLVNGALAYNQLGSNQLSEMMLQRALKLAPTNAAVNLNLALLLGEQERSTEAIPLLRQALKSDPTSATAAYNLGIHLAASQPAESLTLFQKAAMLDPGNSKYAYTLAFYLHQNQQIIHAIEVLRKQLATPVADADVYSLLGSMLEEQGNREEAAQVYRSAADNSQLPDSVKAQFKLRIQALTR
jgi:Tfp pilus assembly protein PilF